MGPVNKKEDIIYMSNTIKRIIASVALSAVAFTGAAFGHATLAEASSWDGSGKSFEAQGEAFAPVRDFTESLGAQIGWVPYNNINLLTFTDLAGNSYEVSLNPATGQAQSLNGFYAYVHEGGTVSLPIQFYKDHYKNISLTFDPTKQAYSAHLIDPAQGLSFAHINPYQKADVVSAQAEPSASQAAPVQNFSLLESGQASYYGPGLNGNYTASGEIFNMYDMTAAHKTLPFGTMVRVTNHNNGSSCVVRINDRGPFSPGRCIDLSLAAADQVGMRASGVAPVTLEILN